MTPVIYLVHNRIEKYLGHDKAAEMKKDAMGESDKLATASVLITSMTNGGR